MRTLRTRGALTVSAMLAVFVAAASLPVRAASPDPDLLLDRPLVPATSAGSVRLRTYVLRATLQSQDSAYGLATAQTYELHNTDRARAVTLRLQPASEDRTTAGKHPALSLSDAQGRLIPQSGVNSSSDPTWDLVLVAGERRAVTLSGQHSSRSGHLACWRATLARLSVWGIMDSARIEFKMPMLMGDDAILSRDPAGSRPEGLGLLWEYENIRGLADHGISMLAPGTWLRVGRLSYDGGHRELARLYEAIDDESLRRSLHVRDHYALMLGELSLAAEATPADASVWLELARLYRTRADKVPAAQKLSYLLLAAQELERVAQQRPSDRDVTTALSRTYGEAAALASESGDAAAALVYLSKASQMPSAQTGLDKDRREELTLRWALSLAEQGLATDALVRARNLLSADSLDSLLRYAPPIVTLRGEVTLRDGQRAVRYLVRPYPPIAEEIWARMQQANARCIALDDCEALLERVSEEFVWDVRLAYSDLAGLRRQTAALADAISREQDLLALVLAAPWRSEVQVYSCRPGPWRDTVEYAEAIHPTALQSAWEQGRQYVDWRLVELRNSTPSHERARLEQRLGSLVLREQGELWEQLRASVYWVYSVEFGSADKVAHVDSWTVGATQIRTLEQHLAVYHWPVIARTVAVGMIALLAVWSFAVFSRSRRGNPH